MMADVVSKEIRSKNMAAIKGKDTKPELLIRKALHRRGYRFRLHDNKLPGKPDLVLPKYKAVIFVNGCFWHKHNCHLYKLPSTRKEFWESKINRTYDRDKENRQALKDIGWRVLTVWECSLKGKTRLQEGKLLERVSSWIEGGLPDMEISGENPSAKENIR